MEETSNLNPPQSGFCIENPLFKESYEKVAQCGGTEVRCGRGFRQTVVALLSVRLKDGERCLTVLSAVKWSSAP